MHLSFSPLNGEVILKYTSFPPWLFRRQFQSPQWGSNSKVKVNGNLYTKKYLAEFQSPQWGSNSKGLNSSAYQEKNRKFQSPQWGSNSKGYPLESA